MNNQPAAREVIHIAGATLEVIDERPIAAERERMVNGKIERYTLRYTAVTVKEIKQ